MEGQSQAQAPSPVTPEIKQQVVAAAKAEAQGTPTPTAPVAAPSQPGEVKEAPPVVQDANENPDFAEQFARLSKKERQLREKERAYQEKIRELEQRAQIAAQLDQDPMSVLESKGWTLDKLLERVATGEAPKPTVEDKVSELQKKLEQLEAQKREAEEYAKAQLEQKVIADYKNQIKTIVDSNASRFEAIKTLGAYETVFALAEELFQDNGKIPEIEYVAELVEKHFEQQLEKAFELQKFKSRLGAPAQETVPVKTQEKIPGANTLTATTTAVSKPPSGGKLLPKEDSLKEAAKLIRWT